MSCRGWHAPARDKCHSRGAVSQIFGAQSESSGGILPFQLWRPWTRLGRVGIRVSCSSWSTLDSELELWPEVQFPKQWPLLGREQGSGGNSILAREQGNLGLPHSTGPLKAAPDAADAGGHTIKASQVGFGQGSGHASPCLQSAQCDQRQQLPKLDCHLGSNSDGTSLIRPARMLA